MSNERQSHWHGYQSGIDWLKANVALMPLLGLAGAAALSLADARYDERYVQIAALDSAVQTIQLGQNEQIITTLDTQLQIAHRKYDSAVTQADKNQYADEIRVLEDAKAAAERQRQKLMR
jgi:hypothetical protein